MSPGTAPRIGVSACIMHADPTRAVFKGKTLLYAEESMLTWLMSAGAIPVLLPRAAGAVTPRALLESVDGLVLQGGVDMSPLHYGEEPARPEWAGDAARDRYEMDLVQVALDLDRPILGVCRGAQVLNVALGGSLYQDVASQHEGQRVHRDWEIYDQHVHEVAVDPRTWLAGIYGVFETGTARRINSVHHQAVKRLGRDLVVEARSVPDGIVEALRFEGQVNGRIPFAYGVQWHPEFMQATAGSAENQSLDARTLLVAFLNEVRQRGTGQSRSLEPNQPQSRESTP